MSCVFIFIKIFEPINYYKIFVPICLLIFTAGVYFSEDILRFFFGAKYAKNGMIFGLLLFAFAFNMLFRNLFGNLLAAVGKIKVNTVISSISLIILAICAYILVPKMMVVGMAISLSFVMIFSGVFFALLFFLYYRKL